MTGERSARINSNPPWPPQTSMESPPNSGISNGDGRQFHSLPNDDGMHRKPLPLHRGYGFGADPIRQKALRTAREATQSKEARVRQFLDIPINKPTIPPPEVKLPPPARQSASAAVTGTPRRSQQQQQPRMAPQQQVSTSHQPPSTLQAAWAGVLDGIVGVLSLAGAIVIHHFVALPSLVPLRWASQITRMLEVGSPVLWQALFDFALRGCGVLFVLQFLSIALSGVSLGRYAAGVSPAQRPGVLSTILLTIVEVISLSGLILAPLTLLMPKRHPLCWWIKHKNANIK